MNPRNHPIAIIASLALSLTFLAACDGGSSSPTAPVAPTPGIGLSAATANAMGLAIDDEYKARATYEAVIAKLGPVDPFVRIQAAEATHIQTLENLFGSYSLAVPPDAYVGGVAVPDTLEEACQLGVVAEEENIAMYDGFFEFVTEPDVIVVFEQLRSASLDSHLPAFRSCS